MLLNRAIRSIGLASLCTLSMVIAHLLGGGEITINWFAPLVFISSTAIFIIKNPKELSGPTLAALLLIFQLVGHASFGISRSDGRMSVAHVVALLISYQLVRHFEEIVDRVGIYITPTIPFTPISIAERLAQDVFYTQCCNKSHNGLRHLSDRAPPFAAAT
ncbi:MAG: hypothetical protein WCJ89_08075 [Actinomycetes bacterium]